MKMKYLSNASHLYTEPWAKHLVTIAHMFDNGEFTGGKVEWLSPFPQFDFSVAHSTIDVCGNEFDLFWHSATPC